MDTFVILRCALGAAQERRCGGRELLLDEPPRCSFCGKRYSQVERLIAGPTPRVAICNECVELCAEILAEERAGDDASTPPTD